MKKKEAEAIAPGKSNLLLEYIDQILSDEMPVEASITITYDKFDKENIVIYVIKVPKRSFYKSFPVGITLQQKSVLDNQILNDIVNQYLESEFVTLSYFVWKRGMRNDFDGIYLKGTNGTTITLNFGRVDKEISDSYDQRLIDYKNSLQENNGQTR